MKSPVYGTGDIFNPIYQNIVFSARAGDTKGVCFLKGILSNGVLWYLSVMCIQELSTCKQYRLPLKIINLNNRYMGMVRQWQEFFHGNRYSESYMDALPDFVSLAESFGHVGMHITRPEDVKSALLEAFARKDDLVFMDFITDQTENVFPMVAAGKGLSEMVLAEEL